MVIATLVFDPGVFGFSWWIDSQARQLDLQIIDSDSDRYSALVWVPEDTIETFREATASEPTVERARALSSIGEWELFEITLASERAVVPQLVSNSDCTLVSAYGSVFGWYCQVRFDNESGVEDFLDECRRAGIDVDVHALWKHSTGAADADSASHRLSGSPPVSQ